MASIRGSAQRSMAALREGAGSAVSGFDVLRRVRMHGLLVIAQIGMALTLFIGGGPLVRSFAKTVARRSCVRSHGRPHVPGHVPARSIFPSPLHVIGRGDRRTIALRPRPARCRLHTLGIRLIDGRGFTDNDGAGQPLVMVINRTVAGSGSLGEHPIGTHVYVVGTAPVEVIGVVEDIRQLGLEQEPIAMALSVAAVRLQLPA